jgi:two-component system, NarL family, nitrate/nitrite response regulator NarL
MPQDNPLGAEAIRVLVADNTRIHTQLLSDALRRDRKLEVIASELPAPKLIETAVQERVRVAVLSANLEEEPLRGLEVLRELRAALPQMLGVILMDSAKREAVVEAFRAGARGIFSRDESLENLSKCVHRVEEGLIWASNEQLVFAVEALASSPVIRPVIANGLEPLSKRELDVVRCLADGLTNREIAARLSLSQHTIKNYLFRVFDKLGVSSRMELMYLTLAQPAQAAAKPALAPGHITSDSPLGDYQKAAEEGVPTAQLALAQMYFEGKGVRRDLVAAYMWYLISERSSLDLKDEISGAKRKLAENLSADQIVEAQRRAAEKLKRPPRAAGLAPTASGRFTH